MHLTLLYLLHGSCVAAYTSAALGFKVMRLKRCCCNKIAEAEAAVRGSSGAVKNTADWPIPWCVQDKAGSSESVPSKDVRMAIP
jgi:hypothetical protein